MPIVNHQLIAHGQANSDVSLNVARFTALNEIAEGLFEEIYKVMTKDGFTRVYKNSLNITGNYNYYLREYYQIENNSNIYIVFEIVINSSNYEVSNNSHNSIILGIGTYNRISESSTTNIIYLTLFNKACTTSGMSIGTNGLYKYQISIVYNLLHLFNDSISVYIPSGSEVNKKLFIEKFCGKCKINDKLYIVRSYNGSNQDRMIMLIDENNNIYYTSSCILRQHRGIVDIDHILTLPMYLTTDSSMNGTNPILLDMKLENTLQTSNNSCAYGSTYKIDGEDYFAVSDNFLVKL